MAAVLVLAALSAFALDAPPLPEAAAREAQGVSPRGSFRFRFLALHVYDATLWTRGGGASLEEPHVLDIRYAMDIAGRDLARRSVEEMRKQGQRDAAKLARWEKEMERIFPDIRAGDRLVGLHVPGVEARFHSQRGSIGSVADPEFARAFFAIWLDPRTSEPRMRARLLGLEAP